MQVRRAPRIVVTIHRGHDAADGALTAAQVLTQPHDAVIRRRRDRHAAHADLMTRDGIQRPDREPARQAAGQLRGAEDGGECGRRRVGIDAFQLGLAADAPRVDESLAGIAVVDRRAVDVELKLPGALHEERPLLAEERLEGREIEHAGVRFNLAEVGIDRRVELQVRSHTVLQVGAGGELLLAADRRGLELRDVLRDDVRRRLEAARGLEVVQVGDLAELRHEPRLRLAEQRPRDALRIAIEIAVHGESEGMGTLWAIRQL
jgi:hypothetical protein